MRALALLFVIVAAAPLLADESVESFTGKEPADPGMPEYLAELQALAKRQLESGDLDGDVVSTSTVQRNSGPISRQEYSRYVGPGKFNGHVEPDSVSLTRPVIPRVVIRDRNAIAYLFDCCAYRESHPDSVDFIEIYDFSRSGFSNGDMMVVHPSGNSYILDQLSPEFMDAAARWDQADHLEFQAFHRETEWMDSLVDELKRPEDLDWESTEPVYDPVTDRDRALRAIWGELHRAVEEQYGASGELEIHFARGDSTTTIEFWGYDPNALTFQYLNDGEGVGVNDLLTVSVSDTLVTAYQTYVDLLVVREARSDTVFVPGSP